MKRLFSVFLATFCFLVSVAQQYTVNMNATKDNCHCYTLTPDANNQSGSVWNNNKIDLTNSFDFKFDVFLGCNDAGGADGIAFVLQPISTSIGGQGGGLGFSGINPSVGVTLDTYQNTGDNDPTYDHIDIQYNGNLNHPATPPRAIAISDNVEDCQWHTLRVKWDASTKILTTYFDDVERVTVTRDIVNDIFSNNPQVFWGFSGATGGAKNKQQFCTALTPQVAFLPAQKKCIGEVVKFIDSTRSFGPVKSWQWDFGDGTTSADQSPDHTYVTAKEYDVKLQVEGADLCIEEIIQKVTIGDFPVADFTAADACFDAAVPFTNNASVAVGTINKWVWDINGSPSTVQNPLITFSQLTGGGTVSAKFSVETDLGCASPVIEKTIKIFSQPIADFTQVSGCNNGNFSFADASMLSNNPPDLNGTINLWNWNFGGSKTSTDQNPVIVLNTVVNPTVSLQVTSSKGCKSTVVSKVITASPKPTAAFRNDNICLLKPAAFFDESVSSDGSAINKWWWDLGQGNMATDKNPSPAYANTGLINVRLAVSSANGCLSDTITKAITIIAAAAADFTVNQPLCENTAISFTDMSSPAGDIQSWAWSFDNGKTSNVQNPSQLFTAGNHSASLTVKDNIGCGSNSTTKNFIVNAKPVLDFSFNGGCENNPVIFSGIKRSGATINEWKWSFGDNAAANIQNPEHIYPANNIYIAVLYGLDINGCYSDTVTQIVDIRKDSVAAGKDIIAAINQPVQLKAVSNSTGTVSFEWSPAAGLDDNNISAPVASLLTDQSYTVKATTAAGCISLDTINIKVYVGPEIYVPSAFTPDGNGRNDILKAIPAGIISFRNFSIYNRLGQIVFSTSDPMQGWDGTFANKAQSTGVYVWIASGIDYNGNTISRKGTVTLIR